MEREKLQLLNRHSFAVVLCMLILLLSSCSGLNRKEVIALATQVADTAEAITMMETAKVLVMTDLAMTEAARPPTDTPQPSPTSNNPSATPTLNLYAPTMNITPAVQLSPLQGTPGAAATFPTIGRTNAGGPLTPNPAGNDRADYVSDNIPNDTMLLPDQTFSPKWVLQNTGTTTWTTDYAIVYDSGYSMGAEKEKYVTVPVTPDMLYEVSFNMRAPEEEGTYKSCWKMRNAQGEIFGVGDLSVCFWIQIEVSRWAQ